MDSVSSPEHQNLTPLESRPAWSSCSFSIRHGCSPRCEHLGRALFGSVHSDWDRSAKLRACMDWPNRSPADSLSRLPLTRLPALIGPYPFVAVPGFEPGRISDAWRLRPVDIPVLLYSCETNRSLASPAFPREGLSNTAADCSRLGTQRAYRVASWKANLDPILSTTCKRCPRCRTPHGTRTRTPKHWYLKPACIPNSTKGACSGLTGGEACRLLNRDPGRALCHPAFCTCRGLPVVSTKDRSRSPVMIREPPSYQDGALPLS